MAKHMRALHQSLRRLQQLLVRRQHFCNRLACEVKVEYSGVNN